MPDGVDKGGGKDSADQERHVETVIKNPDDDVRSPESFAPLASAQRGSGALSALQPSVSLGGNQVKDPVIGSMVNGYVVRGKLGAGGMGIVYAGEHPVIGKRAAIKVLRPEIADSEEQMKRLIDEARAVNQVGHRGIIDVFNTDTLPDGRHCIVMEFLEGEPLADMLTRNRKEQRVMPIPQVMVVLEEILSALSAAHSVGVIHRDLKPSNIFLCKQRDGMSYVKLLDFGIAKLGVLGSTPQTRASMLVGTPSYMAPEQARGGPVGPGMDLYAVGIIAFEMLVGELPFTGESVVEVLMKHAEEPAPKPSSILMSIPDDLDELVTRLLAKDPKDRYQSAGEVRDFVTAIRKSLSESTARSIGLSIGRSIPQSGTHPAVPAQPSNVPVERSPQGSSRPPRPPQETVNAPVVPSHTSSVARPEGKKLPPEMTAATVAVPESMRPREPERSSRGLALGVVGLLLGLAALGIAYLNRPQPPPAVVVQPEPKPPPPPAIFEEFPPPAPATPDKPEPAPTPAPEPKHVEAKPVEAKPEPAPVEGKPAPVPTSAPKPRGDRLLARFQALEKQAAAKPDALSSVQKTMMTKYLDGLKAGTVKPEQRDQAEAFAKQIEADLKAQ